MRHSRDLLITILQSTYAYGMVNGRYKDSFLETDNTK